MFICRRQTQNAVRKSHIQAKNAYLPEEFCILKLQVNPVLSHFLQEPTIFFKELCIKSTSRELADLGLLKSCSTEDCETFAVDVVSSTYL